MTRKIPRWAVILGCATLGAVAVAMGRPLPQKQVGELINVQEPAPVASYLRTDTLHSGEPLLAVLQRHGLGHDEANRAISGLAILDARRVRAGTEVIAEVHPDSGVQYVSFQMAIDRVIKLIRNGDSWTEKEELLPWSVDTVLVASVVSSTLTGAVIAAASEFPQKARTELAYGIADVLEYRIDLSRDLRVGDSVSVLVERETAPTGYVRPGRILAARARLAGTTLDAVRFEDSEGRGQFYDAEGRSLRAAFLRAPLEFRRISSVFGARKHPIHKTWRQHNGIDYAAPTGTPVRAIGDGAVIFAGWKGGYGRTVEIRHNNGMVTRYGHLNTIARGIKSGARVSIASTIGTVGMTGLATGPHLHFETLVNGVHRDPRVALKNVGGEPLPSEHKAAFALRRNALFSDLDSRILALNESNSLPSLGRPVSPNVVGAGN